MKLTGKLLIAGAGIGSTLGALAIYNRLIETMAGELDTVLRGEERRYPWKYGDMFYEVKGARDARPLLLIHSFGPGASSYEWRRNLDALAQEFRVYVIDLLGYGLSDRPAIDYTAETYTDLINDFLKEVINKPTIVVAHGLTCAYVIADAYRKPQLFERLILVAPPPTVLQESVPGPLNAGWKGLLRTPILGQFVYNILTSRPALRGYYDTQGYYNSDLITDELVEYIYTSAHQSNSRYAPASFLSHYLTLDVHEAFARLQMPVVVVWGRESTVLPEAAEAFKRVNPRIDTHVLDRASFQVQDEQPASFNNLVRQLAGAGVR